jgi:lipopolysaccharide heptosyltransferase I
MERFLIVRLGSLGDLVHTLPAVAAIRRAHPEAVIDWLVEAPHAPFLELVPVVTRVITLRERTARGWLAVRRELRARRYDIALDFQGLIKSAALARLSGASRVVGFDTDGLRERLAALFYGGRIGATGGRHVIYKNLALAQAAGGRAASASDPLEFPIAAVKSAAVRTIHELGVDAFMLVNPGAAWPNKRWAPEQLGDVARAVWERHHLQSVVLWGPGERPIADAVVAASGGATMAAPATGLADLIALARDAKIVLSGDTGPLHIAAAVGTPAVALFGPTDPDRNGPWMPDDIALSRYDTCVCHYQRACTRAAGPCLADITVDHVLDAIRTRLARAGGAPAQAGRPS